MMLNPLMPPFLLRRLSAVITLLLVILLGAQVAWWGWHFFAPKPSGVNEATMVAIDPAAARKLFGDISAPSATPVAENNTGIRLKGVYAVDGKTLSAAVINTGGRDTSVRLNEKITDAISLVDVKIDHIIVSRAGVREKIELERSQSKSATDAQQSQPNQPNQANFRLNVAATARNAYTLSRGELNSVLQDPRQINFLGGISPAAAGGVQISDAAPGTLAQKLGLMPGDIITAINGQPVNGTGDLARFYGQFGTTNSIRAEVKRGGSPMLLSYTITP
jgi:general secretion pathway protein C